MANKVLIVDKSLYNRMILRDILITHGYSVLEATTGDEAISTYERIRPDLVTVDATLPGMDGLRVIREIKYLNPDASLLMCGTRGQRRAVLEGMMLGASGVLMKPFNERQVLRDVRRRTGPPPSGNPVTDV